MLTARNPKCWVDRVVDSDTVLVWIEATADVRVRYRVRLVGIEGGELGTAEGLRGKDVLETVIEAISREQLYWRGSLNTRDQHGRLVGDITLADGQRLTSALHEVGHHWSRDKSGREWRQ